MNGRPKLVIITGSPGSGKTTLAKELGKTICFPALIRDEIKEGYVNTFNVKHDALPKETNGIVSDLFFKSIELLILNKVSLIAEAAFPHNFWVPLFSKIQDCCNIFFINCVIDPEISARRHLERGLTNSNREFYHGDKRVSHYRSTGICLPSEIFDFPHFDYPTIKVSTINGYSPSLQDISAQIKNKL